MLQAGRPVVTTIRSGGRQQDLRQFAPRRFLTTMRRMSILEGAALLRARIGDAAPPARRPAPAGALPVFDWCGVASPEDAPHEGRAEDGKGPRVVGPAFAQVAALRLSAVVAHVV